MMNGQEQRILLIMPRFFNYPDLICDELQSMGYDVDFFDDRPSTNPWVKAVIRVKRNFIKKYIQKYFDSVMETVEKKKYDIVFLISGQSLSFSEEMIGEIKKHQQQARFLLYQWDSQTNFPYIKKVQRYFDKKYSFDKRDIADTPDLKFLPLFYSKEYEEIGNEGIKEYKYDFCFVGTAHPKKYHYIKEMSKKLKEVYPNQYIYFFFPSKIVFFYRKIVNRELRHAKINEFHYIPLSGKDMHEVYRNSKCILDSAQKGQLGLTIRVIEALGAKKKLITTNEDIVTYDFYRPENIYIYKDKFDLNDVFFKTDYVSVENDLYSKYSLNSWLKEILS